MNNPEIKEINIVKINPNPSSNRHNASTISADEATTYSNGTFTDGYGKATSLVVEVTEGATADLMIDFTIETVAQETVKQWKEYLYQHTTESEKKTLEEGYSIKGSANWLMGAFGFAKGGGNYSHYENKTDDFDFSNEQFKQGFSTLIYNSKTETYNVKGNIKATGTSHIPTRATAFIQIATIKFTDGKTINVTDGQNVIVGDPKGRTDKVTSASTPVLNMTPVTHPN
ncbi:hypothetical protein P4261_16170 [Bacillus thuringiensis]|nr:hypothetical protein [Bacillus thuringiensis]MED2810040.1 hypothetical protein [Bacillus thuringiensis]MED2827182.1 hypothetical protein [Bacillus thuringiensis]MED2832900.1 hypothetical protein [Bacillus thuringiensis]MED2851104.1 hypothetical protein [Bacillus thuringiensis]